MRLSSAMFSALDRVDRDILSRLLTDARVTFRDLAMAVRLSANATADRVRALERRGVIRGYRAEVDLARLGFTISALIDIKLAPSIAPAEAEKRLHDLPEVLEVMHVTGAPDYIIRVACIDLANLDQLISKLISDIGVHSTDTRVILRVIP